MSKSTNILFSACGNEQKASSRVRVYWVSEELTKLGYRCKIHHDHSRLGMVQLLAKIFFADVVVFQKTFSKWHLRLLKLANRMGKRTVLDLDDAPSRVNNPTTVQNSNLMMQHASLVIAGSKNLFEMAKQQQENTIRIASCIKLANYRLAPPMGEPPVILGWIGNGPHYKRDLIEILSEPLEQLAKDHSVCLKIVGSCGDEEIHDHFAEIPNLATHIVDEVDWGNPEAVADAIADFDIGLYPLLPNDFNHFKCGFKALEYMASGIPVVSSDEALNKEIIEEGVDGYLVSRSDQWIDTLRSLIVDSEKAKQMGSLGRKKVEQKYNTGLAAEQFDSAIRELAGPN